MEECWFGVSGQRLECLEWLWCKYPECRQLYDGLGCFSVTSVAKDRRGKAFVLSMGGQRFGKILGVMVLFA